MPVVTSREEYTVNGRSLLDAASGISRVDLVGREIGNGCRLAVSLFVKETALAFYPIGSQVRVVVERVT